MDYDKQTKAMMASVATIAAFTLLVVGLIYATVFTITFVITSIVFHLLVRFWLWYFDRKDNPKEKEYAPRNPYY